MSDMVRRFFGKVAGVNSQTTGQKTQKDILVASLCCRICIL